MLETSDARQQLPYDSFILPHDADGHGTTRMMLEPPHVVPVKEGILAGAAVDGGNAIGSEFQRPGRCIGPNAYREKQDREDSRHYRLPYHSSGNGLPESAGNRKDRRALK